MLKKFGVDVSIEESEGVKEIRVLPPRSMDATSINIPGDFSSSAFFILGALITPGSDLKLINVGINKTRIAFLEVLKEMGADIKLSNLINEYEPCANISIRASELKGITLDSKLVPNLIDEMPVLFIAAALSKGTTRIRGAQELRFKESDRLESMARTLSLFGVKHKMFEDGIDIEGSNQSKTDQPFNSAEIDSFGDHRIAMASIIGALRSKGSCKVKNCSNISTSFPDFIDLSNRIGIILNKS